MRLCYVLLVAVAAFVASSDATSTADRTATHATRRRHLRSYNMNDLESEDEERFQVGNGINNLAQRVHVESPTINLSAILRMDTSENILERITTFFAATNGVLGGWLQKSVLDGLLGSSVTHKREVFTQWQSQGRTAEEVKELLSANTWVKQKYNPVAELYEAFLTLSRRRSA